MKRIFLPRPWGMRALQAGIVSLVGASLIVAAILARSLGEDASLGNEGTTIAANAIGGGKVHFHPGRPTHIHAGKCGELGDVAYPLNPVGAGSMVGDEMEGIPAMAAIDVAGGSSALPVETSRISLGAPLSTVLRGDHALNIQLSEMDYGTSIACGDIVAASEGENDVVEIELNPVGDSGFRGLAVLRNEGEQTDVRVYLATGVSWDELRAFSDAA